MKKEERNYRIIRLWLERPEESRQNLNHVLMFYGWVKQNHPYLFDGMHGDPYQNLKSVLDNHIPDKD